jgi:hypothetical protein
MCYDNVCLCINYYTVQVKSNLCTCSCDNLCAFMRQTHTTITRYSSSFSQKRARISYYNRSRTIACNMT